jgi:excisionase family DNA binding protein
MTPDKKLRQPRAPALRDDDDWLTPAETAAWLRVNAKLVYRLAKEDPTFPAVKLTGSVLRIRRSRLDRWLEQHHRPPEAIAVSKTATRFAERAMIAAERPLTAHQHRCLACGQERPCTAMWCQSLKVLACWSCRQRAWERPSPRQSPPPTLRERRRAGRGRP